MSVSTITLQGIDKATPALKKVGGGLEKLGDQGLKLSQKMEMAGKGLEDLVGTMAAMVGVPPRLASEVGKLATKFTIIGKTWDWATEKAKRHEERMEKLRAAYDRLKELPGRVLAGMKAGWDKLTTVAGRFWDSFKRGLKNIALFSIAAIGLGALLGKLANKMETFIAGAAELEGINSAFQAIAGEGAPALLASMKAASAGMIENIDLMKSYNSAALLINKTVAQQLPQALEHLTKISTATGESMAFLLDSLVKGVGRLSPRILDNLKIQTSLAEITSYAADMFGKEADALTIAEKQAGAMALTLAKLEARTSGLADVTGSLVALMAQSKVLRAENAKLLASHFIPVAKSFYKLLNQLAAATHRNLSEGGRWYDILRKISATVSVVIDLIGELIGKFEGAGADAVNSFADKMFEAAWKAFEWGANIINNLAIGITRGAANALIKAINFISNILGYWLAPGSAPRFLPHLLAWGSEAFTEYLRGFTEADYGVLSSIQAPLRGALQSLVNLGMMAAEDVGPLFASLSESMAAALEHFRKTGEVSAEVLAKLAAIGGGYGAELEELFRRQMAVAAATQDVADAEGRLAAARRQEEKSSKKLSKLAMEYNKMLKEGASQEALRLKLAEMRAEQETLENAREEAELAEDDLETARERAKEANRLARLQADLLNQLLEMARIREQARKDAEEDGDGIGDPLVPGAPLADMIPSLDAAFEALKDRIRARFMELWADLKADWDNSGVGTLLNDLKDKWEGSELKMWFEEFILDVRQEGIKTALSNLWAKIAPAVQGWLDDKDSWWMEIWRGFTQAGIDDGSGRVDFGAALDALWLKVKEGLNTLSFRFGEWLGQLVTGKLSSTEAEGATLGGSFVEGLYEGLLSSLNARQLSWATLLTGWFRAAVQVVKDYLGIGSPSTLFWGIGDQMIDGLIGAIRNKGNDLRGALQGIVDRAIEAIRNKLGLRSPSRLFMGIGENMMAGLTKGIEGKAADPMAAVQGAVDMAAGAVNVSGVGARGGVVMNLYFGQGAVRSNKDIRDISDAAQHNLQLFGQKAAI